MTRPGPHNVLPSSDTAYWRAASAWVLPLLPATIGELDRRRPRGAASTQNCLAWLESRCLVRYRDGAMRNALWYAVTRNVTPNA